MKSPALKNWFLTSGMILLIVISFPICAYATAYTFQAVNFPGDTFTQLLGINSTGVIAGYHGEAANQGFTLVLPNNFTAENFPGSSQTQVIGINTGGDTCGFYIDSGGVTNGFFRTSGGTFSTIDAPGTQFNQLLGLNDMGQQAGYSSTDPTGMTAQQAYIEKGGTFTFLNSFFPMGTQNSQATGINNGGIISGFYVDSGGVNHGFELAGGTLTPLDFPGSTSTQALGLNNSGQIVGFYTDSAGHIHGFVFDGKNFLSVDEPGGIGTTTINGVNDLGQIVGFFVDANGNTEGFVGTPVPVPSALLLLGSGLVGLGCWRRHRKEEKS